MLASASPRRRELLAAAGYAFEVHVADVDETPRPGESAEALVERLALDKARAVARALPAGDDAPLVLGGDTVVVRDDVLLGKPADADEARAMLAGLAGRTHRVLSGVALVRAGDGVARSGRAASRVRMDAVDAATLDAYLAGGEWRGKAGAYAIQGDAGAFMHLEQGALDTVIGLPVELVRQLLADFPPAAPSSRDRASRPAATDTPPSDTPPPGAPR